MDYIYLYLMKKGLIILFTLVTLFSIVVENYKSFFINTTDIELVAEDDAEGKDSGKSLEKEDLDIKEKYFAQESTHPFILVTKSKFYIIHSNLLPVPYTSLLEIPPEQV